VDLQALFAAERLAAGRERILGVLERQGAGRPATAMKALGLGPGQAEWVAINGAVRAAPAAPAAEVYTGVLYQELGMATIGPVEDVLIASALWGFVRPQDRIPAYKLPIGARLPRLPGLAAWWRPQLQRALPDAALVLDLRSQAYAAAWRPRTGAVVGVRAFTPEGKTISHMAKAVRGRVARAVLRSGADPESPQALLELVRDAGFDARLTGGSSLDVTADP